MTQSAVLGNGPVEFIGKTNQYSIPLSTLYFDDAGVISAKNWGTYTSLGTTDQTSLDSWLVYLGQRGLLLPAPHPPPVPAFTISAKDPGAFGNSIVVTFANVKPDTTNAGATTADVTVSAIQTYSGLTRATMGSVLGTNKVAGSRPGLVDLVSTTSATLSAHPATAFAKGQVVFPEFTIELASTTPTSTTPPTVAVQDVDTNADSFTLVTQWVDTKNIQLQQIQTTFGFFIVVTAPAGGFRPPAEGSVVLSGGADSTSATSAQATVVSSS